MREGLIEGEDGRPRCFWPGALPDYVAYHDREWGYPVGDSRRLFEKICLEGFQSGLSWLTILRKRENFRAAFAGFDFHAVAAFGGDDVARLMSDAGIVRHRGKIESTLNNAKRAVEAEREFGSLAAFFWRFEPEAAERAHVVDMVAYRAITVSAASKRMAKELKRRGWSFVGPTTCYAFAQAMGLVNDHLEGCFCRPLAEAARAGFERPEAALGSRT